MLTTVRLLDPLVELRGITPDQWARDAGISPVTLRRYLNPRTGVGDEAALGRLLAEAECFVVVTAEGVLGEAWKEAILAALEEQRARRGAAVRAPG
jgi:hypothetical protein